MASLWSYPSEPLRRLIGSVIWSFDVTPPASPLAIMNIAIKATNIADRDCDGAIFLKIDTMLSIQFTGIVRCGVFGTIVLLWL